jgi:hypothetical protein
MNTRGRAWVWCMKREGHKGDHRGYRAQWNQDGKTVSITLPLPEKVGVDD